MKHQGACFCGAVTIEASGTPIEMGFCHCQSCRSYSGGPMSAFILWRDEDIRVTSGEEFVGGFNKVGTSDRKFCTKCGGHLMTRHPGAGIADTSPGVLPTITFIPTLHLNYSEAIRPVRDGLVKLRDFPEHAGGTGRTIPE